MFQNYIKYGLFNFHIAMCLFGFMVVRLWQGNWTLALSNLALAAGNLYFYFAFRVRRK